MPSLTYGLAFFCPGEEPLVVGLVLGEEQRHVAFAGQGVGPQHRVRRLHRAGAGGPRDLLEQRLLRGPGDPGGPVVAEPERGQQVQLGRLRPAVGHRDLHQDVLGADLGVLDEDVEVPVALEDPGVEELVLHLLPAPPAVGLHQVVVGEGGLRVLVEVLHVRMGRRAVEVEVVLLDVLAVVALAVGEAEEPLLEDGVLAVPQGQREAEVLPVVGEAGQAVLAPAVGARAGLVVREVVPGVAALAVVLAHRAPLPLAEVGPPLLPVDALPPVLLQPAMLGGHQVLLAAQVSPALGPAQLRRPQAAFTSKTWCPQAGMSRYRPSCASLDPSRSYRSGPSRSESTTRCPSRPSKAASAQHWPRVGP